MTKPCILQHGFVRFMCYFIAPLATYKLKVVDKNAL